MWWQVLPPLGILGGMWFIQFSSMGVIHYVFTGRPSLRNVSEGTSFEAIQKHAYRRDTFMVGNEYEGRGLDFIEDE